MGFRLKTCALPHSSRSLLELGSLDYFTDPNFEYPCLIDEHYSFEQWLGWGSRVISPPAAGWRIEDWSPPRGNIWCPV